MRTILKIIPSILLATAIVASAQNSYVSQPAGTSESSMSDAFAQAKDIAKDRLEVGLRISHFTLVDDKKESGFLGSIDELEADQDYMPTLYGRFFFTPYVGVELGYDKARAITRKFTLPPPGFSTDDDSDGTIVLEGPSIEIVGRYPNETIFTPYAGFGPVLYGEYLGDANFEHTAWWHNGFDSIADERLTAWEAEGRPKGGGGKMRTIELSETMGWMLSGGVSVAVYEGLQVELSVQYVWAEVDAHYYLSRAEDDSLLPGGQDATFPMDHWTYQLGLKYAF